MKDSTNSQKVLKGISSQTFVTILLGGVELISFSIMSRLLTKEDFGYYAAITAITTVFASFSETGIGSAIVQQKNLTKQYVDNAFSLSLIFGLFISSLLFFLSGTFAHTVADSSMKFPLQLMSVTLLMHCLTSISFSIMLRKLQFLRIGFIKLFSLVVTTLVAIGLALEGYGYYAIITKAVLSSVITYFLALYYSKTRFSFALDKKPCVIIFSFSGWLMASVLFRNLASQVDKLLMPRLLSVVALGAYNRPKEFIEQISTKLNGIFDSALFPVLSNMQDDKHAMNLAFRKSMYFMNIFAMVMTLLLVFSSSLMIRIFFGEKWIELTPVMMMISCTLLFNTDGRLADCYLRSLAMTKQQFFFRVFETILKLFGVLVSYRWGIIGVALSFVITNSIVELIKIVYIGSKVDVTPWASIKIILSSWRFCIFVLPVSILSYYIIPNNLLGNLVSFSILVVVLLCLFLIFPEGVGEQYKQYGYAKAKNYLANKFRLM